MSWDFYNEKNVKTRNVHRCFFCGRLIPIGTVSLYWSGMWDKSFQSSYACQWCEKHRNHFFGDDGEGVDFWDAIREDIFAEKLSKFDFRAKLKLDGNYLVFMHPKTWEVVHREYCPTVFIFEGVQK